VTVGTLLGAQGCRHAMFPNEDEADAVVYDDYGAPVDDDIFKPSEEALGGSLCGSVFVRVLQDRM